MGVFLGLDSSTQSLSALILDTATGAVLADEGVVFGADLPEYASPHGFLLTADASVCHADPRMWAHALDVLLERLSRRGFDLGRVDGVTGAAQQHGSVYLARGIDLDAGAPDGLAAHVAERLARATAPIWLDSSTTAECEAIAAAAGGAATVSRITGSRPVERFTGPQIRKLFVDTPDVYARTREVHLVSSFMASLLVGTRAPVDLADGAGTNLLDLAAAAWSPKMLAATAPRLQHRLPPVVPSTHRIGTVARYFVDRYGFRPGTPVVAFTGDNPSSLVGLGATSPGDAVASLGTSDTYFAATETPHPDPDGFGHVFGNPAGGFLSLVCFANGSLARERVAEGCAMDWPAFEAAIRRTAPGNGGNLMLPYFVPEMTPRLAKPGAECFGSPDFVEGRDPAAAARAIVEAQAVTMRIHSEWVGHRPSRIRVTGGASRNGAILQILSDVLEAELLPLDIANASAMGAALRAAQAIGGVPWQELHARFSCPDMERAVRPRPETRPAYARLERSFREHLARRLSSSSRSRVDP